MPPAIKRYAAADFSWKVFRGRPTVRTSPFPNLAMEIRRTPAALRLEEHRYYVPGSISGVSAQGVLSRQSTRDVHVDVRAGLPFRKVVAASVDQVEDAYAIARVGGSVDLELQ